jgi:hypothetical protein
MKIYILSKGEYDCEMIIGIYASWQSAFDVVKLNDDYAIEIWELETNTFVDYCQITDTRNDPFRFVYREDYSRDIDPSEAGI